MTKKVNLLKDWLPQIVKNFYYSLCINIFFETEIYQDQECEAVQLQRPSLDKTLKTVLFQQIDIDFYEGFHLFFRL